MSKHSHQERLSRSARDTSAPGPGGAGNAQPSADELWPPAELVGQRYRLRSRLGHGRLGHIFEACDEESSELGVERRVAIQLLDRRLASNQDFVDKLRRGYTTLRAGSHPNIVELLDFGQDGRTCFLVMELLEGASLRLVLDGESELPVAETAPVIRAVCDALQYLHAKSMLHGRLAPESVFVTHNYEVKLLDIVPLMPRSAVADAVEPNRAHADAGARDDVYGLACLMYELLSGKHPFNSNSPLEARRAALQPVPIDSLSARQWHALTRGLALERAQRTPNVTALCHEFGISSTARLKPPEAATLASQSAAGAAMVPEEPLPAEIRPTVTRPLTPASRAAPAELAYRPEWRQRRPEPAASRGLSAGRLVAMVVVAGLGAGAWLYRDQLRQGAVELIAAIDARLDAGASASVEDSLETIVVEPPAVASVQAPPADGSASLGAEPGGENGLRAAPPGETGPAEHADATAIEAPAQRFAGFETPQTDERLAGTRPEAPGFNAESNPLAPSAVFDSLSASPPTPQFGFLQSPVAAAESQGAVQIHVQRGGNAATPSTLVWWTQDAQALAGADYAEVAPQTESFAVDEQSRTLFIPLINDSLPEPTESFYVHIGRHDPEAQRVETISSVRVDIADDD